jgi:hypothetical protein
LITEIDKNSVIIFIHGLKQPADKKAIILRSLKRGYEMLSEKGNINGEYCYGEQIFSKWIKRLDDDNRYKTKKDENKNIDPELFNLAERRFYGANFFEQAQDILDSDLADAINSFRKIHDRMWDIHGMVKGDNRGKLLERQTRMKIMEILMECRQNDLRAAKNIGEVLGNYKYL